MSQVHELQGRLDELKSWAKEVRSAHLGAMPKFSSLGQVEQELEEIKVTCGQTDRQTNRQTDTEYWF